MADPQSITVVMPTHNRRELLQRAIESVLSEHRVPLVLHVFDNASTDDTEAVVRSLMATDERIRYVRRPENIGSIPNFQRALGTVDTAYFVPLADDDILLPDFLHDAYRLLEESPHIDAAVFGAEHRDVHGTVLGTYPSARDRIRFGPLQPNEHLADWMEHGHYMWSSVLWRRNVLETVGAPYMCTGLPSDVDFQAQIFARHLVHLVDRPGAVFLSHPGQESSGYDTSHVVDWGRVFKRLDRALRRSAVLAPHDYRRLRLIMTHRLSPNWQAPPVVAQPLHRRVRGAFVAGRRLGDPEAAHAILRTDRTGSVLSRILRWLPAFGRSSGGGRR